MTLATPPPPTPVDERPPRADAPASRELARHLVTLVAAGLVTIGAIHLLPVPAVWNSAWRIVVGGSLAFGPLEMAHRTAILFSSERSGVRIRGRLVPVEHSIRTLCISGALGALLIGIVGATLVTAPSSF